MTSALEMPRLTIRAAIVDDEAIARERVRATLSREPDVDIVGECGTATEALALIRRERPDVVLLDVRLGERDGFSLIAELEAEVAPLFIFITAYDEHALRAFDVQAVDYVLKPFDVERLRRAVERARTAIRSRIAVSAQHRIHAALADLRLVDDRGDLGDARPMASGERTLTRIAVRTDDRIVFVRTSDVDWFEGAGNYVKLHVRDQEYRVRACLRNIVELLDRVRFRRIHRSTIVNVDRIREVQPWFGGDYVAILHDGRQLRVSRTFASDLLDVFQ